MKEEDKELEILKAKRLAEMEKNLAQQNNQEEKETVLSNSDQNPLITPFLESVLSFSSSYPNNSVNTVHVS